MNGEGALGAVVFGPSSSAYSASRLLSPALKAGSGVALLLTDRCIRVEDLWSFSGEFVGYLHFKGRGSRGWRPHVCRAKAVARS